MDHRQPSSHETVARLSWGAGIAVGMGAGVALGSALDSMAVGIAVGLAVGIALMGALTAAAARGDRQRRAAAEDPDAEDEPPGE